MAQQSQHKNESEQQQNIKNRKKIIMRSETASSELGIQLGTKFDIRCGANIQADIILPGPPISWAILLLEKMDVNQMSSATNKVDRMVNMFEHAIVVCVNPSQETIVYLQNHLRDAGKRHLMTKLLIFPDMASTIESMIKLCPLLCDARRRRNQSEFINQLREDAVSEASLLQVVVDLIDPEKVWDESLVIKDANLLLDRFRSLSCLFQFGESQSFEELLQSCPLETSTVHSLDNYFMADLDFPTPPPASIVSPRAGGGGGSGERNERVPERVPEMNDFLEQYNGIRDRDPENHMNLNSRQLEEWEARPHY